MDAQQLQQLLNALQQMVTNAAPQNATPANLSNANLASSIDARLSSFNYNPEVGTTFECWFKRYGKLIEEDGSTLPEASKVRLLLGKLGEEEYNKYRDTISPTQPDQVNWNDTISHLKQLFAETRSLFVRRYECFKIRQQQGQDVSSLIAQINASCENADLSLTKEQLKCIILVIALSDEHHDLRQKALKMRAPFRWSTRQLPQTPLTQGRGNELTQRKGKATPINGNIKLPIQVESQHVVVQRFRMDHVANPTTGAPTAHSRTQRALSATEKGKSQQFAGKRKQRQHRTATDHSTPSKSTQIACKLAQLKADGGS
ncbi:hypothetical protein niasHS_006953 [Heterodera schachtii]|uniref:DUF7083 domain-containing protein n=1 Tax=Heterodera schachtii TaxID=97005 RepID=A0ABD2JG29_HETSC